MEILTKKRMLIISDTIISYSATLLWLLCYDYIFYYLYSKGINCKPGIPLGLLLHGLRDIIISLSIIISLLKSKKIKIAIFTTYFVFSSYFLLPENPHRWLYFSLGTVAFLYLLDSFVSLLKIKNDLKENILHFFLLIVIYIIFIFFWNDLFIFFFKYFIIGNFIITICMLLYCLLRDKYRS